MSFQENLKYYREKAGYKSAKEFANTLGIPPNTYVGYEVRGREPKYEMLCKIADLLQVSTDDLLGREDNYSKDNIIKIRNKIRFSTYGLQKGFYKRNKIVNRIGINI